MNIDLIKPALHPSKSLQSWEFSRALGYAEVRPYLNLGQAVSEVLHGLLTAFPHRRQVATWKNASPLVDQIKAHFLKEGWLWQEYSPDQALTFEKWAESLKSDTLFFLIPEDDPATGRLFPIDTVASKLAEKKIFQIRMSHSRFLGDLRTHLTNPYSIRLISSGVEGAIGLFGARARVPSSAFGFEVQNQSLLDQVLERGLARVEKGLFQNEKAVREFEAARPAGFEPWFSADFSERLWDRAVLYTLELDSSALLEELGRKMGWPRGLPGQDAKAESLSLCRWAMPDGMFWLQKQNCSLEKIRGTLILDASILNPELLSALAAARKEILRLQG